MSNSPFDPKTFFETYRNAFAPALKAQQESVKAFERLGRYQYAVAGDYLEWSLAHANAAVAVKSPAELVTKQVELATALSEKLRIRAQEFVSLATDAQTTFTQVVSEATAKAADLTKEATVKAADAVKKAA
ncbi:MAG TPA: phasin family protein [Bryobacteraceae bacterium]|jgi:phasin family protein|nr:phasin family protein [Bryobacteraceae bacterium]